MINVLHELFNKENKEAGILLSQFKEDKSTNIKIDISLTEISAALNTCDNENLVPYTVVSLISNNNPYQEKRITDLNHSFLPEIRRLHTDAFGNERSKDGQGMVNCNNRSVFQEHPNSIIAVHELDKVLKNNLVLIQQKSTKVAYENI